MNKIAFIGLLVVVALLAANPCIAQKNKMTAELLWKLGRVSGETLSPDGTKLYYGVTMYDLDSNRSNRNIYMIPINGGKPIQITDMSGNEYGVLFRPDGKKIGFISDGQIWEANPDGSDARKITSIEGGVSHFKYSPDGKRIAYSSEVKIDENVHDLYPDLPYAEARIIDDLMYRHWDHWEDGFRSHIFIADYHNGQVSNPVDIMAGEPYDCPMQPFGGAEDFVWHPEGFALAYVAKKEVGVAAAKSTNSDIYLYHLDKKTTLNFTEGQRGYDTHPQFSKDGKYLFWLTMFTPGYESDKQYLMQRSLDVSEKYIFGDNWDHTISGYALSADGQTVFINAGEEATYQVYSAKTSPKTVEEATIRKITDGVHNIGNIIGVSNGKLFATKTDMNHAAEIYSYSISSGKEKKLTSVNDHIYNQLVLSNVEKRWVETVDGKQMLVWVIFPPNFDKNKRYPALLYAQGGPQSAVSQFYSFRWNFQLMAANDYIIIAPNRRGLPTFGEEWNREISGDWGGLPMQDYMRAVEVIRDEPYVDPMRIGAIGASYGGYSVYMLAGIHGDMFCSFLSHCGLFNLESWYGTTEELFFANFDIGGPYWSIPKPKSYDLFSPHKYVHNWTSPIMVIHGGNDFRVPINQGMEAFQAAKLLGLKTRFLYFPNEGHWILKPQNGLLWHSEFFKWLDETVKNREL